MCCVLQRYCSQVVINGKDILSNLLKKFINYSVKNEDTFFILNVNKLTKTTFLDYELNGKAEKFSNINF